MWRLVVERVVASAPDMYPTVQGIHASLKENPLAGIARPPPSFRNQAPVPAARVLTKVGSASLRSRMYAKHTRSVYGIGSSDLSFERTCWSAVFNKIVVAA